MAEYDFQVLVIGSGPGGYVAALRAAHLGLKVACVEKMDSLGGTCLNMGCIPSKALLQSSKAYQWIKMKAPDLGVSVREASYDYPKMIARKESIISLLSGGIAAKFAEKKIERIIGEAKFNNPHSVTVGNRTITAENVIIATGSEPLSLPFLKVDETQIVTSTGALNLKKVPKKMVVIGAGVIGVELASVYKRLGTEVTIVEMLDVITPTMDAALSKQLLSYLKKQQIDFLLGAKVKEAAKVGEFVKLSIEQAGKVVFLEADTVLVAIGRKPFTKNLGLENAGIKLSDKGFIIVDDKFRTNEPNVYAIGDVIEGAMLAHRASYEGTAVAELIAGNSPNVNYMIIPNVIYTDPEVASVGFTEAEAKSAGLDVKIGTSYFKANGRARCSGETDGFVKIIGEKKSGRLVGMHIIGPEASELIAEGMIAMEMKATVHDIAFAPNAHPTLSETIMEAAMNAL